jgi:pentatricopeptide repeat protein
LFMAFAGLVGKELMEMAHAQKNGKGKVLSSYVPSGHLDKEDDAESKGEGKDEEPVDQEEQDGVQAMKAARSMGGMFSEDGEDDAGTSNSHTPKVVTTTKSRTTKSTTSSTKSQNSMTDEKKDDQRMENGTAKPRQRFHDKLSDLQIEEAKAKGRAQLALLFEMLTMMKKRALQADPEAYQVLIDACGRVGDTKRATELLAKMHEDGIVADGTVYACLVSAFSAENNSWKDTTNDEELPEWANSTAVDMDWNKLQKRSFLDRVISQVVDLEDDEVDDDEEGMSTYQKLKKRIANRNKDNVKGLGEDREGMEFFVTESVERQIALGENLLEIVSPFVSSTETALRY